MGQLDPLEHNQHPEGGAECPACMMTTEVFNAMSLELEKGSLRLCSDDLAFIIALLFQTVTDAAPTDEARISFIFSFIKHMHELSHNGVRWLVMSEAEAPTTGAKH
jgi:hypothetical protein